MLMKKTLKTILPYFIILVVVVVIRTFIATPVLVDGPSMEGTLYDNDVMILNKLADIDRNDIVVVNIDNDLLIKRIVGMPGELVEIYGDKLYINGVVNEDVYWDQTEDSVALQLADNEYYVLGDNRFISKDSRIFGAVKEDQILGESKIIVFPFSRIGIK